jgi:para-nitrobenzyl esterase
VSNLGFQDQIACLKWVNKNISKFGGDPDNVTIFGESAGSQSVCALLAIPAAKGLFQRAIGQSGASNPKGHLPEGGENSANQIFTELKIEHGDLAALKKTPVKSILDAQNRIATRNAMQIPTGPSGYPPIVDGSNLPEHPLNSVRKGSAKSIDLLLGTNLDEATLFTSMNPQMKNIDKDGVLKRLKAMVTGASDIDDTAEKIYEKYSKTRKSPIEIINAIMTDAMFRVPAILTAEAQSTLNKNTYMYLFTYPTQEMGGNLGSTHALEIPFVFGVLGDDRLGFFPKKDEVNSKLSEQMMDSWISFARTGNPNHKGIPEWPSYEVQKRQTMILGVETKLEQDPYSEEREVWNSVFK